MPNPDRSPWGWTGPARGLLILVATALGLSMTWISIEETPGPLPLPTLEVDANSAPPAVLGALPGIGPVLAGRIVEAREALPFRTLDDLDRRVKGIGPVKVEALRPFLRFGPAGPSTDPNSHP
jgi:competence protein ComEA